MTEFFSDDAAPRQVVAMRMQAYDGLVRRPKQQLKDRRKLCRGKQKQKHDAFFRGREASKKFPL